MDATNSSIAGPGGPSATAEDDWSLNPVDIRRDGGISIDVSKATRISDVVVALEQSTVLTDAITQRLD